MNAVTAGSAQSPAGGCGVCGATHARELYTATDRLGNSAEVFLIARCEGCGVLRTLPDLDQSELARYYPSDYWGADADPPQQWISRSQSDKLRFLRRCGLNGGRVLDVGCGGGFFLRALDPTRWDRFGVETGSRAAEVAAARLGCDRVFTGTLSDVQAEAGLGFGGSFDVITLWSVLEHTIEPRAELATARRLIEPGGTLIVQAPDAAGYQARLFRGKWFALDAPRHRYHFSADTLEALLDRSGFEPYYTTSFSKAHNAHALRQSLRTVLAADRSAAGFGVFLVTIPLIRPVDLLMTAVAGGATMTVAARAV